MTALSDIHRKYDGPIPPAELGIVLAGGEHNYAVEGAKAMSYNFSTEAAKAMSVIDALGTGEWSHLCRLAQMRMRTDYGKELRFYEDQLELWQEYLAQLLAE